MVGRNRRFALADTVQQVVGGFILAGAFVVTEEVWVLARSMSTLQALVTVAIVCGIGYGTLYKADSDRDPDREVEVGGIPLRFVSLIVVSYVSVVVLALAFDAPWTFLADLAVGGDVILGKPVTADLVFVTMKATTIGSVFSVIGAATADSVF
jgi:uncharacterized membrane protein